MQIIKFQTSRCTPCKMVDNMLNSHGLTVDKVVDIEEDEVTRASFDVMKSPTLILIDDEGNEVKRVLGLDEDATLELFKMAGRL